MMLLLALGTQRVMTVVSQQAQREREAELLRAGTAIAEAIGRYHEATPGSVKRWPVSLDDLLEDRRLVVLRRHLRQVYADPMTRDGRWGLMPAPDGGVAGVYSLSESQPIASGSMEVQRLGFSGARSYREWRFVFVPAASVSRP